MEKLNHEQKKAVAELMDLQSETMLRKNNKGRIAKMEKLLSSLGFDLKDETTYGQIYFQ